MIVDLYSVELIKTLFDEMDNSSCIFMKNVINAKIKNVKLDLFPSWYPTGVCWKYGEWFGGVWDVGIWIDGVWHNGTWENGYWHNGEWENGVWENGNWEEGAWKDGIWEKGVWKGGTIYNPETGYYEKSDINPNECEWSLSYKKVSK